MTEVDSYLLVLCFWLNIVSVAYDVNLKQAPEPHFLLPLKSISCLKTSSVRGTSNSSYYGMKKCFLNNYILFLQHKISTRYSKDEEKLICY